MREPLTTQAQSEIRKLIETRNLTFEGVAERVGWTASAVSNALRRPNVQTATLERLANALGGTFTVKASASGDL